MTDKFKFNAWDKKHNKMYYEVQYGLYGLNFSDLLENEDFEIIQCTGLKDKNGNLIYEGDIVSLDNGELKGIAIRHEKLDEHYGCVFIRLISKYETLYKPTVFAESKVIGNIYENKELLEVQND